MGQRLKSEQSIFLDALDVEAGDERDAFLAASCGGDDELRNRVNALLKAHLESGDLLDALDDRASSDSFSTLPAVQLAGSGRSESPIPTDGVLGDFTLTREIGRGGMGVVYEARQTSLKRRVALKVLPFAAVLDQRQLQRFETEAKAAAGLHHAHIVPVYHFGSDRAVHFYAMQYIEGRDVAELIKQLRQLAGLDEAQRSRVESELASSLAAGRFAPDRRPPAASSAEAGASDVASATGPSSATETRPFAELSTKDALSRPDYFRTIADLGIQAAEALAFAHQHGILHRDVKPSNLMLDTHGKLWITDFGLARIDGDDGLTLTGDVMGTLRYMSPEQALGERDSVDHRSDVYSLGVTLYEMLSLTPVYPTANRHELLQKRQQEEPTPLRQVNSSVPVDLETIVHKAIAREPTDRYATAQDLADDLQRFLNHEPIQARRATLARQFTKWTQRNRTLAALVFCAAFLGGVVAASIVVLVRDRDGDRVAEFVVRDGGTILTTDTDLSATHAQGGIGNAVADGETLSGLIPYPEKMPGIGRTQLISRRPGSFVHHDWSFDWSPDGQFIAFGDGSDVRVLGVPSLRLMQLYSGHENSVTSVAWSPDGQWIASASVDRTVRLWNAMTGEPGPVLEGHRDRVDTVDWHPDGRLLASGGRDCRAMIWDVEGGLVRILPRHPANVSSVAWSPDGDVLATGDGSSSDPSEDSLGGSIRFWDRQGLGDQFDLIDTKGRVCYSIRWRPDGKELLSAAFWPRVAEIRNLDGTDPVVLKGHTNAVVAADWSPDGTYVATASWDNTIRLWRADGVPGPIIDRHDGAALCVKWSPDGTWLASSGVDHTIRLWRPDGTAGAMLTGRRPASDVAWSPGGERFVVACEDHTVRLFRGDGTACGILEGHTQPVTNVEWCAAGDTIVSSTLADTSLRYWTSDGTARRVIECPTHESVSIAASPDGMQVARAGHRPVAGIQLWNLDGSLAADLTGHDGQIYDVVWSPKSDRLASVGIDQTLRVWDRAGQAEIILNTGQLNASVDWKPDGTQIACGCDNGQIHLCQPDGRARSLLDGHENRVTRIRWSSDGRWIASGSRDSTVRLWTESGQPVAVLSGHLGKVTGLAWEPGTHRVLSSGLDGTIRLWDVETQTVQWVIVVLPGNQSVTFSPDGRVIDGDPAVVDREFACIVEQPNGAIELVKPSEFAALHFHDSTKPGDRPE